MISKELIKVVEDHEASDNYVGRDIRLHEWPMGCEITDVEGYNGILIKSPVDAVATIESLFRYLDSFGPKVKKYYEEDLKFIK